MNASSAYAITQVFARCEAALEDLEIREDAEVCVLSRRSPVKPSPNEDAAAVLVLGATTVLAVADGVGGRPGGAEAARAALGTLRDELGARDGADVVAAIPEAIEIANKAVIAHDPGGATTLAIVAIENGVARAYHVGDAGVMVVGGRGRVHLHTIAHSPVGYALEAGLLDEERAMSHAARHFVSNVLGDPEMRVEASAAMKLRPRDTVLLASDGLFDNLYRAEIVDALRTKRIGTAVRALGEASSARMLSPADSGAPSKPDDLTIVAWRGRT